MSTPACRPRRAVPAPLAVLISLVCATLCGQVLAAAPQAELVSRTGIAAPLQADGSSTGPNGVSANGRFVVFPSTASKLGAADGLPALLVHDAADGSTQAVDVAGDGMPAGVASGPRAGVSDDGRYIVFSSGSPRLAAQPTFGVEQVYRRDRQSGSTQLLSRGSGGSAGDAPSRAGNMSADGRYSVFESAAAGLAPAPTAATQIYRHDAADNSLLLVSAGLDALPGSGGSSSPQISADGRYVLFASDAANLVAGDSNSRMDLFLRDLQLGLTQRVNVTASGAQSVDFNPNAFTFGLTCSLSLLSHDGRYAVFSTTVDIEPTAPGSRNIFRFDRVSGVTDYVNAVVGGVAPNRENTCPAISADGQRVTYWSTGSTDPSRAIYLRDYAAGTLQRLPVEPVSAYSVFRDLSFALTGNGSQLLFASDQLLPLHTFAHVYRFDIASATLDRLSSPAQDNTGPYADNDSGRGNPYAGDAAPGLSSDARYVVFASLASNLVVGDSNGTGDIFLRDRLTATTQRISLKSDGSESPCYSETPAITPDGRYVMFASCGALVAPGVADQREIYRYDRVLGLLELVSIGHAGQPADDVSYAGDMSDDGNVISFRSCAGNLTATPVSTSACQAYVRDLATGITELVSRSATGQPGTNGAQSPRLSADGRLAVFTSGSGNLPGDNNGHIEDIFVFDRASQTTTRLNIAGGTAAANGHSSSVRISAAGDLVLFRSVASNLAAGTPAGASRFYVHDRTLSTTVQLNVPGYPDDPLGVADISADGRYVAFVAQLAPSGAGAFDDSGLPKLWIWERQTGSYRALTWFERRNAGRTIAPRLSADGHWVAFNATRFDLDAADGNGAFSDIFLLRRDDALFGDGFE
jgi:Tol biopolymer transport system component